MVVDTGNLCTLLLNFTFVPAFIYVSSKNRLIDKNLYAMTTLFFEKSVVLSGCLHDEAWDGHVYLHLHVRCSAVTSAKFQSAM